MRTFPDDVQAEASGLAFTEGLFAHRPEADGFTVDGSTSKDLDDAIHLEQQGDGWVAHISIADVAALIGPASRIYEEALHRVATQYRATYNVPMLPDVLSENLLSLLPREARPAITFSVTLSEELEPTGLSFRRTVLRSKRQLNYASIDAIIEQGEDDPDREMFRSCLALAQHLMDRRRSKGALAIYDLTKRVYTTEEGFLVPLNDEYAHKGNIIVQEFMILCNSAVAHFMAAQGIPFLYRNHTVRAAAPHRQEIVEQLNTALLHPRLLELLRQRTALWFNKATYDPVLTGHFGLNEVAYAHVTSPIRRAADLINHQILAAYLDGAPLPHTHDQLSVMAAAINKRLSDVQESSKQYHKARSLAETRRRAATAELDRLLRLTPQEFQQILKQTVMLPALPEAVAHAVAQNIERQTLGAEHLYTILFSGRQKDEQWGRTFACCMQYVDEHRELATSLIHMHSQNGGMPGLRIDVIEHGGGFAARAVVNDNGTEKSTSSYSIAASKKDAQHNACLKFLHQYLDGTIVPVEQTTFGEREQTQPALPRPSPPETEEQNHVGLLGELRMKHPRWQAPEYVFEQRGPSHQPIIVCTCRFNTGEQQRETKGQASNKKAAKQLAASQMLALVGQEPVEVPEAVVTHTPTVILEDVEGGENFVGQLEELCMQRHVARRPAYEFQLSGPAHQPVVTCTGTMDVEGESVTATSVASTKKTAKQVVACKLLRMLQAAPPRGLKESTSPVAEENYVGRLIEMAQQHDDWSEPLFDVTASGASHLPLFTGTCSMTIEGELFEVKGTAWQKQAARHAAARAMIELVAGRTLQHEVEGGVPNGDHVARLTDLCIERSLPLPRITFEEWANTTEPTYTCKASIKVRATIHKASGVGSSRSVSLEAACRELLTVLEAT